MEAQNWIKLSHHHYIKMAPQVGFEPTTDRLTADCSTTELLWNDNYKTLLARRRPTLTGEPPPLPSALKSLTTVFGMGTGVTSSLSPPDFSLILHTPYERPAA